MKKVLLSKSDRKLHFIVKKAVEAAFANTTPKPPTPLLTEDEAAQFLSVAKGTLPVWRHQGKGPKFIKISTAVRYRIEDLYEYISSNTINPDK